MSVGVITILIMIGVAVLGAFYTLIDPRSDIKDIRASYLSLREHLAFETRVARDIVRLEGENAKQVSRDEFMGVARARDAQIETLTREITELQAELHQHERDDRALNGLATKH